MRHRDVVPAADARYGLAEVSEEARDGWVAFCRRYDTNRTALAEVMGRSLGKITGDLPPQLREWVTAARALEDERRSRGDTRPATPTVKGKTT